MTPEANSADAMQTSLETPTQMWLNAAPLKPLTPTPTSKDTRTQIELSATIPVVADEPADMAIPDQLVTELAKALEHGQRMSWKEYDTLLRTNAETLVTCLCKQCKDAMHQAASVQCFAEADHWKRQLNAIDAWSRWPASMQEWSDWLQNMSTKFPTVARHIEAARVSLREQQNVSSDTLKGPVVSEDRITTFGQALQEFQKNSSEAERCKLETAAEQLSVHLKDQCNIGIRAAVDAMDFETAQNLKEKMSDAVLSWVGQHDKRDSNDPQAWREWTTALTTTFPQLKASLQSALTKPQQDTMELQTRDEMWIALESEARTLLATALEHTREVLDAAIAKEEFDRAQYCHKQMQQLQMLWCLETLPTLSQEWTTWLDKVTAILSEMKQHVELSQDLTVDHLKTMAMQMPPDLERPAISLNEI